MMRWTNVAAATCGALLLAGCGAAAPYSEPSEAVPVAMWDLTTPSPEARRQVQTGVAIMDMNMLPNNRPVADEANEYFKRAVTEDPSFAFAYLLAAITAPSFAEFRANLEQARELAPGASEAERLQIEYQQKLFEGDLEEAAGLARQLIALKESNPRAWMLLARVQSQSGHEEEARESATRAVEIEPDFTQGHLWLANSNLLFEPRDLSAAEVHVQRALALEPEQSAPHDLDGDFHRANGRLEEAAAAYTRAAELDPTDAGVLLQRGHAHTFSGEYEKARADYDASADIERTNKASPLSYRALVSAYAGDNEAALAELSELDGRLHRLGLAELDGVRMQLKYYQAMIGVGSGQLEAASQAVADATVLLRIRAEQVGTDEFRRAREADIAYWEGMLAAHGGDYAGARSSAAKIRKLLEADRDPAKDRGAQALLGLAALGEKRYVEAIGHLEQTDPNNEYMTYQRGLALEGAGRTEEASEIYRALASNNFNTPELAVIRLDAIARARR